MVNLFLYQDMIHTALSMTVTIIKCQQICAFSFRKERISEIDSYGCGAQQWEGRKAKIHVSRMPAMLAYILKLLLRQIIL